LVLVVATAAAIAGYQRFLDNAPFLWGSTIHDRHAHYHSGISLATDIRNADLIQFIRDVDLASRVWQPMHAVAVAMTLLVFGSDYRIAVLPNLLAWFGSIVLAFMLARRIVPRLGTAAGIIAALLVMASPAHRAFATDLMIESLGAFFTLLVLYAYVVVNQNPTTANGRWFAVALTLLFVTKYNYWVLALGGLLVTEFATRPRLYTHLTLTTVRDWPWAAWLGRQLRSPITYAMALPLVILAAFRISGAESLTLVGYTINVRNPHNLITVAYWAFVVHLVLWWRVEGREFRDRFALPVRSLAYWHAWPVAIWFLWPKRLAYWIWYMDPASNSGEAPQFNLLGGYSFYWHSLIGDYHVSLTLLISVIVLLVVAGLLRHRLRSGASVVLLFVLISAMATIHHPNRKSRYAHTWTPAAWVMAGAGLALLVDRLTRERAIAKHAIALAACGGAALVCLPAGFQPGHAPEGGPNLARATPLRLVNQYAPHIRDTHRAAVLSNLPMKFLPQWHHLEKHPAAPRLETECRNLPHHARPNQQAFQSWLQATRADAIVFIHIPPGSAFYDHLPACAAYESIPLWMEQQTTFALEQRLPTPDDTSTIFIWRRAGSRAAR
jgi:hypothetical protein